MSQNELTVSGILMGLDDLPNESNLIGVMRAIVVLEQRVDTMLKPVNERRTNQHADLMEMVFRVLEPVYDQKDELGSDLPLIAMRVYQQAISAAITALGAEGIKIELNTNGKIKTPANLGQYDTNVQRVLEHDFKGIFLDVLPDGTYKYQSKPSIEKLGKELAKDKKDADQQAAIDRLLASGKGHVLSTEQKKTDDKQKGSKQEQSVPVLEPEPMTAVSLALAELTKTIKGWSDEYGEHATVRPNVSVDEHIIAQIEKLNGNLSRYFADTCRLKLGDALNKAASKAA